MEQNANDNTSNSNQEDKDFGDLVRLITDHLSRIWNQLQSTSSQYLSEVGTFNILDQLARKTAKHPYMALGISLACLTLALPLLIIFVFAVSTVVMTFTGFIFLEGTLVTVASILLCGCLVAVLLILLFFGGITLTGYFGFMHIYDLYSGLHNKAALINFLDKEKSKTH